MCRAGTYELLPLIRALCPSIAFAAAEAEQYSVDNGGIHDLLCSKDDIEERARIRRRAAAVDAICLLLVTTMLVVYLCSSSGCSSQSSEPAAPETEQPPHTYGPKSKALLQKLKEREERAKREKGE